MIHTLDIYRRLLSVHIRSQMQYRISFMMDLISTALIVCFEFGAIALVLQQFGDIDGWTLAEVAFLYGLAEISFGLMDLTFAGFDPPRFGRQVRQGTFDQLLLRPINITVQVMGADLTLRRLGKILFGLGIFGYALQANQIIWTPQKIAYLPLVILGLFLFSGSLFIIGSTITFWTVDSVEVMNILTYGSNFTISYPMSIYPNWIRLFFTFVVPAIFLTYYPALYFLDRPELADIPVFAPFLAPFVGIGALLVALRFWRFGVKHYQSTGS
ncbi:MAG: ABC transporter permease [Chloroflexi bacterium]|nr:ABC transporter permease [Chloroflexota bacterium]